MIILEAWAFGINSAVYSTVIIVAVLCVLFALLYPILKKFDPNRPTPMWLVPLLWIVDLINLFVKDNIGKRWKAYAPWFLSMAILIFFSNISAVFLLDNPTGYLVITLTLAMMSFFIIQYTALRQGGIKGYLKGFLDPIPVMLPMNIMSELSLPISLCFRLFGNITSGTAISMMIKGILGYISIPIMPFVNLVFDIAFGVIQVAVFIILSILFTSMKIKDEEKIY